MEQIALYMEEIALEKDEVGDDGIIFRYLFINPSISSIFCVLKETKQKQDKNIQHLRIPCGPSPQY